MAARDSCEGPYKKVVMLKCYDALAAAGFTRYRKENVDWPLGGGFNCWVGLNVAVNEAYVEVNPFVGIHAVPIMQLYAKLEGRKYNRSYATYAVSMGAIAPREPMFRFSHEVDIEAESTRLARVYATHGLSYSESIASYEELLPLLQERVSMLGAYPERVACCLYLMGRREEAQGFVEDFLERFPTYFQGFAVPFLKMLAQTRGPV